MKNNSIQLQVRQGQSVIQKKRLIGTLKTVENLIIENKIQKALVLLLSIIENKNLDFEAETIHYLTELNHLENKYKNESINNNQYEIKKRKLIVRINALIQTISELEEQNNSKSMIFNKVSFAFCLTIIGLSIAMFSTILGMKSEVIFSFHNLLYLLVAGITAFLLILVFQLSSKTTNQQINAHEILLKNTFTNIVLKTLDESVFNPVQKKNFHNEPTPK